VFSKKDAKKLASKVPSVKKDAKKLASIIHSVNKMQIISHQKCVQ
jgi:hypothetical protein